VVGIVLVSVFFFTQGNPEVEQLQVVETEVNGEVEVNTVDKDKDDELAPEVEIKVAETEVKSKVPEHFEEFKQPNFNTPVAEQEVKKPLQDEIKINSDMLIAQKVEEVVAQVEILENAQQDVTDAEVDSLLRAAQRQILTDKLFSDGGSVDAMSLLAEVEDELDESFRDQIFDALKSGYLKLRTAVADRNQ
jgi:outer membrane protein assembly factor BamA